MDSFQQDLYYAVTKHALEHGEDSDPDHEVGDLQDVLAMCLNIMSIDQARKLYTQISDRNLID
jgi:DNA-binding SARP family transcriptional activator